MKPALRKVGFWVVVGLVAVTSERIFKVIALGPVGDRFPGVRTLAAS